MANQGKRSVFRARAQSVLVATALCLAGSAVDAGEYKYPYHDPYLATATTAILGADGSIPGQKREVVHVPGLPNRNHLPGLEGRGTVSITVYRQDRAAPLVFILAGIGSNAYFGLATYLAQPLVQEGFHVVILPSPMNWNFALAASRTGAPGNTPDDARDLYDTMQRCLAVLKAQHRLEVTRIGFIGASLGALEGAYLSVIDSEQRRIGIDTYLLLNPPLDLAYAIKTVDTWTALSAKFGPDRSKRLIARGLGIVESFSGEDRDDHAVFDRVVKKFRSFTTDELQFLMAAALQMALPELASITRTIYDPLPPTPAAKQELRRRLQFSKNETFTDYTEKLAVPLWRRQTRDPRADFGTFAERGSLASIVDRLRGNSRVHIIHNADDPLVTRASIERLRAALGNQVTVFPYGGHLGNVWYRENKELALRLLGAAPRRGGYS
jgi:hypothetical protein